MQALALVDAPDHVCYRYRIRAFEPALAKLDWHVTAEGLARGPRRLMQLASAGRFDAVIVQRKLLPGWQLSLLRRSAKRLIFDFDDAVLFRDSYDRRGPHSARRARRFGVTVRAADAVLAGNDFLADCALRAGASVEKVRVVPTCIPVEKYEPESGRPARDGLELVWIGSSSTLQGLEQRRGLWDRIAREIPGVRMRVVCDRFPDLGAMHVVPIPWREAMEAADLAAGDVGVTWVPDDLWSRGKCGLKVLQYQAAGLPVLANPVGVHPEMIQPGVSGWLPKTDEEWVNAVKMLVADPGLRARMSREARASVERGYSVKVWEGTFAGALAGATSPGLSGPNFLTAVRRDHGRIEARG